MTDSNHPNPEAAIPPGGGIKAGLVLPGTTGVHWHVFSMSFMIRVVGTPHLQEVCVGGGGG